MNGVTLLFPPLSEATFFPYLSLPYLTSYLKEHNIKVQQQDINIELIHYLLKKKQIRFFLESNKISSMSDFFIHSSLNKLISSQEIINSIVYKKEKNNHEILNVYHKVLSNNIKYLTKNSVISKKLTTIDSILSYVNMFNFDDHKEDIPLNGLLSLIKINQKKIVGISIPYYSQILPSLLMCKYLKQSNPDIQIILGGPQIYLWSTQISKNEYTKKYVDFLGIGDGEETLLKLCKYLNREITDFNDIPNIIRLKDTTSSKSISFTNLNSQKTPDFTGLPIDNYIVTKKQLSLTTCTGCFWGKCAFCSYGNKSKLQNNYQQKSPKNLAKQCLELHHKYNINHINFTDENTNLKLVLKAMEYVKEKGVNITYTTRNRMEKQLLDFEYCYKLKKSGCTLMSIGYETNSQRILDSMNKGVYSKDYQKIVNNLYDVGIEMRLSVMTNFPDETLEEHLDSLQFLKKNREKIEIDIVQPLSIEPNTYISINPNNYNVSYLKSDSTDSLEGIMGRLSLDFNESKKYKNINFISDYYKELLKKESNYSLNNSFDLPIWVEIKTFNDQNYLLNYYEQKLFNISDLDLSTISKFKENEFLSKEEIEKLKLFGIYHSPY